MMRIIVMPEGPLARYTITYFDPLDEEGVRVRTWVFDSLGDAEGWRGELGVVWREQDDAIHICEIGENEV